MFKYQVPQPFGSPSLFSIISGMNSYREISTNYISGHKLTRFESTWFMNDSDQRVTRTHLTSFTLFNRHIQVSTVLDLLIGQLLFYIYYS